MVLWVQAVGATKRHLRSTAPVGTVGGDHFMQCVRRLRKGADACGVVVGRDLSGRGGTPGRRTWGSDGGWVGVPGRAPWWHSRQANAPVAQEEHRPLPQQIAKQV